MNEKLPKTVCKTPFKIDVEAGKKYFWCSCGLTALQPFCDGRHKGSGMKSVHYVPETSGKVWLCGCKLTKNPPFCDGSHASLVDG